MGSWPKAILILVTVLLPGGFLLLPVFLRPIEIEPEAEYRTHPDRGPDSPTSVWARHPSAPAAAGDRVTGI